jgi:hypothetical protein
MSMTVEEFADRLHAALDKRRTANAYMHAGVIQQCINEALDPPGHSREYPKALYHGHEMRLVNNSEEEAAAKREGFGHAAPPQFPAGYPKFYRERTIHDSGTKYPSGDIRKVMLHDADEERLFHSVTESEEWMIDDGDHGGRGIAVAELVEERRQLLMSLVGAESFEENSPAAAVELPCDVVPPDDPVPALDPDSVVEQPSAEEVR